MMFAKNTGRKYGNDARSQTENLPPKAERVFTVTSSFSSLVGAMKLTGGFRWGTGDDLQYLVLSLAYMKSKSVQLS